MKNGKPSEVILKIKDYEEMLEQLEDVYDLKWLKQARKKPLSFKKLSDVLSEVKTRV